MSKDIVTEVHKKVKRSNGTEEYISVPIGVLPENIELKFDKNGNIYIGNENQELDEFSKSLAVYLFENNFSISDAYAEEGQENARVVASKKAVYDAYQALLAEMPGNATAETLGLVKPGKGLTITDGVLAVTDDAVSVVDNLESESAIAALSAKQGKVLAAKDAELEGQISAVNNKLGNFQVDYTLDGTNALNLTTKK